MSRRLESAILSTALAVLVVLSVLVFPVSGEYGIQVRDPEIIVNLSADFNQGVRNPYANTTEIFANVPVFAFTLEGDNASLIAVPLRRAVETKSPGLTLSQIEFIVSSNGTLMHYDLSFHLQQAAVNHQGVVTRDLAWRSFVMTNDFRVAGVSINDLFPSYLGDDVIGLTQESGFPVQQQRTWYLNGRVRNPQQIVSSIPNLTLFNFTSLSLPLDQWKGHFDLASSVTTWRASGGFNLTFVGKLTEPETFLIFVRNAVYNVEAVIQAPGFAKASGDEIFFEANQAYAPSLMSGVMASTAIVLIGTLIVERRYRTPASRWRKKKKAS